MTRSKRDVENGVEKMRKKVQEKGNLLYGATHVWESNNHDSSFTDEVVTAYMDKYHPNRKQA